MSCPPQFMKERWDPESKASLARWRRVASHHEERPGAPRTSSLSSTVTTRAYCNNKVVTSRYTLLTFVPLNLWEQVQRPLNAYFVVLTALLCVPEFAPVSPLSLLIPLCVAFALSGMKEAFDDYRRHKGDTRQNMRLYRVYNPETGGYEAVHSANLRVGDVVLLIEGDEVPCDMIPLVSANILEGSTYCSTANLDGEADSKTKHCVLAGAILRLHPEDRPTSADEEGEDGQEDDAEGLSYIDKMRQQVAKIRPLEQPGPIDLSMAPAVLRTTAHMEDVAKCTVLDCEAPSRVLTTFHGTAIIFDRPLAKIAPHSAHDIHSSHGSNMQASQQPKHDGTKVLHRISLGVNELIVSTSVLTSMPYTIAIVVYTGNESKIHRSRRPVPVKWSVIDRMTNRFAVAVFLLQWSLVLAMTIVASVQNKEHSGDWYLKLGGHDFVSQWVFLPIRFFLLLSVMVPLSVKVTLELSKFYISELIEWDTDLYDEQTDTAATVNSRALTEELGLVQFVMADKTGTLTENTMRLRRVAFATDAAPADSIAAAMSPPGARIFSVAESEDERRHKRQSYDESQQADISMRVFHVPDSPDRAARRPIPPQLSKSDAANLFDTEPMALHLAYAIALNNSCEVSTEQVFPTGAMSRQNSKGSAIEGGGRGDTPPPPSATPNAQVLRRSYASTSPDEVALVEAISYHLDFTLLRRTKKGIALRYPRLRGSSASGSLDVPPRSGDGTAGSGHSSVEHWELVGVVPFSSDRGLMSVFLQNPTTREGIIYIKGSDERVLPLCGANVSNQGIAQAVDEFAADGLRTLVFAMRRVSADWANNWRTQMTTATTLTDVEKRTETVKSLHRELERGDLTIVGATGVEDELQAEVPEAIRALRKANMRVWMLTGDKHMTAVQTGRLSGLLKDDDKVITFAIDPDAAEPQQRADLATSMDRALRDIEALYGGSAPASLMLARESYRAQTAPEHGTPLLDVPASGRDMDPTATFADSHRPPQAETSAAQKFKEGLGSMLRSHAAPLGASQVPYAVVVTGRSLELITRTPDLEEEFFPIIGHAATVVCCRVTPDQKAMIVAMMRRRGALCLAIGDGGNDVAMIQEADVGIGITGKEGRQAAQAADFNIAKFRYLLPLLFCHGHTAIMRSAYLVQYTFYKSIILAMMQAYYNVFFAMSSGVSYFDAFALTMYNGCFTLVLSLLPVLDTHLPRSILRRYPKLYTLSQSGGYMNRKTFNWFIARGIAHSLVIFVLATYIWTGEFIGENGHTLASVSTEYVLSYCALCLTQCMIVAVEFRSITVVHAFFIPFSFVSFFICYSFYSAVFTGSDFFGAFPETIGSASFCLAVPLIAFAVMIPFGFVAAIRFHFFPSLLQQWRQRLYMGRTITVLKKQINEGFESGQ